MSNKPKDPTLKRPRAMTANMQAYCLAWIAKRSQIEAYREAYQPTTDNIWTIRHAAHDVHWKPAIQARIAELMAEDRKRCAMTIDDQTARLFHLYETALEAKEINAARAVLADLSELHGLIGKANVKPPADAPTPERADYADRAAVFADAVARAELALTPADGESVH